MGKGVKKEERSAFQASIWRELGCQRQRSRNNELLESRSSPRRLSRTLSMLVQTIGTPQEKMAPWRAKKVEDQEAKLEEKESGRGL